MSHPTSRIGVDFGTTNSVVARVDSNGGVFRSILCFQGSATRHVAGPAAADAYLDDPGGCRLMLSLKSHLAQAALRETLVFGRRMELEMLKRIDRACPGLGRPGGGLEGRARQDVDIQCGRGGRAVSTAPEPVARRHAE